MLERGEGDVDQKEVTMTTLDANDALKDGSLVQADHEAPQGADTAGTSPTIAVCESIGPATFPSLKAGLSGKSQLSERSAVMIGGVRREAAEHDALDAARRRGDFRGDGADGDARGAIGREAVDAGRDRRKGDRGKLVRGGEMRARCGSRTPAGRPRPCAPPLQTGPTAWITCRAGSR